METLIWNIQLFPFHKPNMWEKAHLFPKNAFWLFCTSPPTHTFFSGAPTAHRPTGSPTDKQNTLSDQPNQNIKHIWRIRSIIQSWFLWPYKLALTGTHTYHTGHKWATFEQSYKSSKRLYFSAVCQNKTKRKINHCTNSFQKCNIWGNCRTKAAYLPLAFIAFLQEKQQLLFRKYSIGIPTKFSMLNKC